MSAPLPVPFAPGSWAAKNRDAALACCRKAFGKVPRHQLEWVRGLRDAVAYRRFRQANLRSIRALMARMTAAGVSFLVVGVGPRGGFDKARCQLPKYDLPAPVVAHPPTSTQTGTARVVLSPPRKWPWNQTERHDPTPTQTGTARVVLSPPVAAIPTRTSLVDGTAPPCDTLILAPSGSSVAAVLPSGPAAKGGVSRAPASGSGPAPVVAATATAVRRRVWTPDGWVVR